MRKLLVNLYDRVIYAIGTNAFFVFVLAWFLLQAIWLAYSGVYSLPFDEYYHFGIITIYADQWSPFIHTQPVDATLYGDITRLPSYLYHYLMSFPYRLFELAGLSERATIVGLRLINVSMVTVSLILFRKLLLDNGISRRTTNLALALATLTPIVVLLAAHINYDNLMLLLMPVWLMYALAILRNQKSLAINLLLYTGLGLMILLVKNTFAPLLLLATVYLSASLIVQHKKDTLRMVAGDTIRVSQRYSLAAAVFLVFIMSALFVERYGGNLVAYGSIKPSCEVVQSEAVCSNYMPWYRNQQNRLTRSDELPYGVGSFTQVWLDRMLRGYYATFSHAPNQVVSVHEPFGPIVLKNILFPSIAIGGVGLLVGVAMVAINIRRLWRDRFIRFSLSISAGYLTVLYLFNLDSYFSLGQPQAIQARYTLPIVVILLAVMVYATSLTIKKRWIRAILLGLVAIYLMLGGITNRLIQTDEAWLWPDQNIINASHSMCNSLHMLRALEIKENPS